MTIPILPPWLKRKASRSRNVRRRAKQPERLRNRLCLEILEDRRLLSTVTNLNDSGPGSLREAIAITPPGDTVDFQSGLSGTITLRSGELLIAKDLTIAGPGADNITVSGNNASRIFNIAAPFTVTLSGMAIGHGRVFNADGGGILNAGTLTVADCTLSGDSINDNARGSGGGGIYNSGGTLTVIRSSISANSTISGHDACSGGGIYNSGGMVTVIDSTINGNFVMGYGGGIFNSGTLTIRTSTIRDNSAIYAPEHGGAAGGILNTGTVAITGSTLSGNSARGGGGGIENRGALSITGSTLSGNSAGFGGGIENGGPLTVTGSTFRDNSAGDGGGIFTSTLNQQVAVINCTFSGNSARGGYYGGGIDNYYGTLAVTGCTLSGNSAGYGGGIATSNFQAVTHSINCILAANAASLSSPDVSGTLDSQGHNLIGDGTGGSGFADTDLVGTADFPIDPQLQPLGDYGGTTQTMRPLPGSPVINAGDNTDAPATDQRGFPRIVLDFIDIGAVELQPGEFGGPGGGASTGNAPSHLRPNTRPARPQIQAALLALGSAGYGMWSSGLPWPSLYVPAAETHSVPLGHDRSRLDTLLQRLAGSTSETTGERLDLFFVAASSRKHSEDMGLLSPFGGENDGLLNERLGGLS